ncbi:PREDICTED: leucine-rich repeat-containing protein 14-like, partial [Ficedula albicollis]|uniref:Leucine-rich repeat-containing protein 14 n=1 Tax=Ficedula albicollis TaxID=59894 RepID=A0A803V6T5_FICAL
MDSLLLLCARCILAQRPLPHILPGLYPVLFQLAFLDGKHVVLRDLVAAWPIQVLDFQQLVRRRELLGDHPHIDYIEAVIQAVVAQLRQELEEPGCDFSKRRLRVLDMTGLSDSLCSRSPDGVTIWSSTVALAKAFEEVSKHQQDFQRREPRRHKGPSGAAVAALQPSGVDVHANLYVRKDSYRILRNALQTRAASPLRLKCHKLYAENISALKVVTLLECLYPSFLQRVELWYNNFGLTELLLILPHLSRFPELRSLKLLDFSMNTRRRTPDLAIVIRCVARHLGMLPSLRELSLGSSQLSGNLRHILCNLQAPLESLELGYCSLVPDDLAFLSQSFHAPALKKLDLTGNNVYQGLLEPLQLLLEETSASLLHLDLSNCDMADSQLEALLPALRRCSRLRFLRLFGNSLSTAAIILDSI